MNRAPFFAFIFGVSFAALAQEGRLVAVRPGGDAISSAVEMIANRPLSFTTLELQSPPRIVVDFADTVVAGAPAEVSVEDGTVRTVATAAAGAHTARVVIELVADAEFDVRAKGNAVVVRIPRIAPRAAPAAQGDAAVAENAAPPDAGVASNVTPPDAAVAENAAPPDAAVAENVAPPDAGAQLAMMPDAAVAQNALVDGGVESEAEKRASLPTVSLVGSRPAQVEEPPPATNRAETDQPAANPPEAESRPRERDIEQAKQPPEQTAAAERRAEAERIAAEKKAAADHRAAVAAENRAAAEKRAAEKKAAAEKRAGEKKAAAEKLAAETKAAAERREAIAAERRAAARRAATDKEAARAAEQQAAAEKVAAGKKAAAERRAAARKAATDKEAARAADQRAAAEKLAADKKAAADRRATEKAAARSRAAEARAAEKRAAEERATEARRVAAEKAAAAKKARAAAAAEAAARKSAAEKPPPLLTPEQAQALREAAERGLPTGLGQAPEAPAQPKPAEQRRVARADSKGRIAIHSIGFRPSGGGELVVRSEKPLQYGITGEERAVLLHLPGATIPRHGDRLPLDTHFFEGPVARVVPLETATGVDLRIELRARAEYRVSQDGDVLTVAFSAAR